MFYDFPALSNRRPELIDRISESYPGKVFGSVMAYIGSITGQCPAMLLHALTGMSREAERVPSGAEH